MPTTTTTAAPVMTSEACRLLGITQKRLNAIIGDHPDLRPPIVAGRRIWAPEHIAALAAEVARRDARHAHRRAAPAATSSTATATST